MANQRRIFGFILTLVPSRTCAEDLMQDTIMIMWRKFSDFKKGGNFAAWGITIARYNILKFRREKKNTCIKFSSEAFEELTQRTAVMTTKLDERFKALEGCLGKLNEHDGSLIQMRYSRNLSIKEIAQKVGRPVQGMYKAMARIHNVLQECINRTLAAWEMPS
jgi:RNA polymerase sigma-70 factor (ECF subfamily)